MTDTADQQRRKTKVHSRTERILAARVAVTASKLTGDPIPDAVRELAKAEIKR